MMWLIHQTRNSRASRSGSLKLSQLASLDFGAKYLSTFNKRKPGSLKPPAPTHRSVEICRNWTPQSIRCGLVGMKCGMTQTWTQWGEHVALTVVEVQDLQVVQVKTEEFEGFNALQLGGGWQKRKRLGRTMLGQFTSRNLPFK